MRSRFAAVLMLAVLALLPAAGARGATGDSADVAAALAVVNQIRAAANLPPVTVNTDAGAGATATARYSVLNDACVHNVAEDPNNQYSTPVSRQDWGAQDQFCSVGGPMSFQEFANAFMTLPYHAVAFVNPQVTQVGMGYYQAQPSDNIPSGGLTGATDFNFVIDYSASATYPVLFPANGKTYPAAVTPIYGGGEDPDPLANCAGYSAPTGAPLIAQFVTSPSVASVALTQDSSQGAPSAVQSCWFTSSTDANHDLAVKTLIVLPKAQLTNGTYHVCVTLTGSPSVAWTFGVGAAPAATTAPCAGQAAGGPPANFASTWNTDSFYNGITLAQTGNQVTGCIQGFQNGAITGTVTGNQLTGQYQVDITNPGLPIGLSWTLSADGTTFTGTTDNNGYPTSVNGTRTTSSNPCTPANPNPTTTPSNPSGGPSTGTPANASPTPTPSTTPSNGPPPGCSTPAPGSQFGICTQATPVAEPGTANTILIQSGNNQQLALNSAGGLGESFAPLSVGGLAPGVSVTFTCSAPSGVLCSLANGGPQTVPANASGVATLASNGIGIYSQGGMGTLTVRATAPGYASATFSETVLPPPGNPNPTSPSVGSAVYAPPNVAYQQLPGVSASDIGVGADGSVWVTGTNQGIYQLSGPSWTRTDGAAIRIAVGPDGTPWVVNSAGSVYHRVNNAWQLLSATVTGAAGPLVASDIGVGADGSVWVTGTNQGIHQLTGTTWNRTDGAAVEIAVGPDGTPWVVNSGGSVYHRVDNAWQLLSATITGAASPLVASDIGVGADGTVWVTGANQDIYQLAGTTWTQASGAATEVTVQNSGVFYVANVGGAVYMGTVTP
jgi:hypothetical protein